MTTDRATAERIATAYVLQHLYESVEVELCFPLAQADTWAVVVRVKDNVGPLKFGVVVERGEVKQDDAGAGYCFEEYARCAARWPRWAGLAEVVR